jgi:hypothetical protein
VRAAGNRLRCYKTLAALAALAALLCVAAPARADLTITAQEDNGATQTILNLNGSPTSNLRGAGSASTTDYDINIRFFRF